MNRTGPGFSKKSRTGSARRVLGCLWAGILTLGVCGQITRSRCLHGDLQLGLIFHLLVSSVVIFVIYSCSTASLLLLLRIVDALCFGCGQSCLSIRRFSSRPCSILGSLLSSSHRSIYGSLPLLLTPLPLWTVLHYFKRLALFVLRSILAASHYNLQRIHNNYNYLPNTKPSFRLLSQRPPRWLLCSTGPRPSIRLCGRRHHHRRSTRPRSSSDGATKRILAGERGRGREMGMATEWKTATSTVYETPVGVQTG